MVTKEFYKCEFVDPAGETVSIYSTVEKSIEEELKTDVDMGEASFPSTWFSDAFYLELSRGSVDATVLAILELAIYIGIKDSNGQLEGFLSMVSTLVPKFISGSTFGRYLNVLQI
ncbi:hypothetical protein Nepgr_011327 [Nepenthes gracilis]|uniref:Uncharacterized protein n=1 Tax=Nepenthes gracilis TaxID=150966 RepID=A0AAD3SEY9_NEPGR|nr:hypothetical protein Nepgr_011327 [Nepenthes gracilis]